MLYEFKPRGSWVRLRLGRGLVLRSGDRVDLKTPPRTSWVRLGLTPVNVDLVPEPPPLPPEEPAPEPIAPPEVVASLLAMVEREAPTIKFNTEAIAKAKTLGLKAPFSKQRVVEFLTNHGG